MEKVKPLKKTVQKEQWTVVRIDKDLLNEIAKYGHLPQSYNDVIKMMCRDYMRRNPIEEFRKKMG